MTTETTATHLTADELAAEADVPVAFVRRLTELGAVQPDANGELSLKGMARPVTAYQLAPGD